MIAVINQTSDETASQSLRQGQTISCEVVFRRSRLVKDMNEVDEIRAVFSRLELRDVP